MKKYISYFSLVLLTLVILLSVGLVLKSFDTHDIRGVEDKGVEKLEFIGKYSLNGEDYKTLISSQDLKVKKGDTIVLVGNFNKTIENKEILFTIMNFKFSMKVNGKSVAEYGHPGIYPSFLKSAGYARHMQSFNHIAPEDEIEIKLTYPYNRGGSTAFYTFINQMYFGEKADFYYASLTGYGILFLIVSFIILIGVFSFITAIFFNAWKRRTGLQVLSFSLFILTCGIWSFMDTFYMSTQVIMPYTISLYVIDMINMLLLPLCAVFFLASFFENATTQKIASIIIFLQLISIITIIIMQVYGIKDIYENQIISIPVNALAGIIMLIVAFYEAIRYKNKGIQTTLIALVPTAIGIYIDILIYYMNLRRYRLFFRIGFIISVCIQLITSVKVFKKGIEAREREHQLQNQLTNLNVSIMLSQIQPHFLYNALNAIQYICMEDGNKAAKAIKHFAKYLRCNMDSLNQRQLIPFKKELDHLESYLYIEYLRFGNRVKVEYNLDVTDFLIPCLIVQPIVENSIRYGITRKVEGGTVRITTEENDTDIIITISDDGIGFDVTNVHNGDRSHIGIENVKHRLKLQCNGSLTINSVINSGTTVTIKIPREENFYFENTSCR